MRFAYPYTCKLPRKPFGPATVLYASFFRARPAALFSLLSATAQGCSGVVQPAASYRPALLSPGEMALRRRPAAPAGVLRRPAAAMDDELPRMLGSSGASRPARANASSDAAQLAVVSAPGRTDNELSLSVISQVRSLGHYPKRSKCQTEDTLVNDENQLAIRIW